MVEGPGCRLKGEKIRGKVLGQIVTSVSGTAVERKIKSRTKTADTTQFDVLTGLRLDEVQTLGKELFMYFHDKCLRLHFLMNGSFRINNKLTDPDAGSAKSKSPVLVLQMSKDSLAFYESSVDMRKAADCRQKHEELKILDICSPVFSHRKAIELVSSQRDRLLCDILLDQSILPGVGNIIKNEALFDSGIKPDTKADDLKEEHLSHLIRMTRDFSMLFYQCRKNGVSLYQYMKVYGRETCGQCNSPVVICRMGEVSDRVTYFCAKCQTNDLKNNAQILPKKNSLLGWLQSTNQPVVEWTCSVCTLVNMKNPRSCEVCLSPRVPVGTVCGTETSRKSLNTLCTESSTTSGRCHGQTTSLSNADLQTTGLEELSPFQRNGLKRKSDTTVSYESSGTQSSKRPKVTTDSCFDKTENIPVCPGHGKKCAMREVRKEGENLRRMFFVCSLSRDKQCDFFKWADDAFPVCTGHGKPCTIRTVMKQGPNNRRKFFTCAMSRKKQCGFFQWAEGFG